MTRSVWCIQFDKKHALLHTIGNIENQINDFQLEVGSMFVRMGVCSWTPLSLILDVWKWSYVVQTPKHISYFQFVVDKYLHSTHDLKCLLEDPDRNMLCNVSIYMDNVSHVICDICGEEIKHTIGKSKQIYCCSMKHVGTSRHPGSDHNLNWCTAALLAQHISPPPGYQAHQIVNEIKVCMSESALNRSPTGLVKDKYYAKWLPLLCIDILLFEYDYILLLSFICWQSLRGYN